MADASAAPGGRSGPPGPATPPRSTARPARARRRPRAQLLPPVALANAIEASVHQCSRALIEELKLVIPPASSVLASAGRDGKPPLLAVPTAQRTEADLTEWGDRAAKEKDDCLERFAAWARCVCDQLLALGHWADFIDPCSGHPMLAEGRGAVFSEVDCFASMLRYPVADAGGCRIVLHPAWGSRFYPATMFTTAPLRVLVRAVAVAAGGEPAGDKDPWLLAAAEGTAPDHQDPDA